MFGLKDSGMDFFGFTLDATYTIDFSDLQRMAEIML